MKDDYSESWSIKKIADIAYKPQYGYTASASNKSIGPKFVRITDITDGRIDWSDVPYCKCPQDSIEKYKLKPGDILFARTGTTGSSYLITETPEPAVFASYLIRLQLKKGINPFYLNHFFNSHQYWKQINQMKVGAVQSGINASVLSSIKVPVPRLVEQRGIVEVLGTVDECIRLTDEVIGRAEELKRGLMQRLLTRGIGHTEYKQTPLGEIPKTWNIKHIKNICYINKKNVDPEKNPDKIIKYIDIASINNFEIKDYTEFLGKNAPSRARRVVYINDVIVSTVRPYLRAFAKISKEYDGHICSTGFAVLTPKKDVNPEYLFQFIKTDIFINTLQRYMVGSSYPAVTQKDVEIVNIPIPPLDEQDKITKILSTTDYEIKSNYLKKEKLELVKRGLLQILFSGKVRVELREDGLHRIGNS